MLASGLVFGAACLRIRRRLIGEAWASSLRKRDEILRTTEDDQPSGRGSITCVRRWHGARPHAEHAARRAHGAYFTTKPSVPPGLVSRPPPRSAATEKSPATSAPPPPKRFDQRCAPLGEYLARNMSPPPRSGSRPPPKSTAPVKLPVTITLPLPSSATLVAPSSLVPPKLLDHRGAPSGEYSARKMSRPPALVSSPVPKSAVFWNSPVTATFPPPSTPMPCATSKPLPPNRLAHKGAPSGVYFTRKTSGPPALVTVPKPKLTVPLKYPVTSTLLAPSTAMAVPLSKPELPTCLTHRGAPDAEYFATKTSPRYVPAAVRGPVPKLTVCLK